MKNNDFKNRIKYSNPDQQDIYKKVMSLLDQYQKSNSFENREFLCYLTAAIYLTYRKLFPQLSIYIPFRTKSDMSYIKNIQKEFDKFTKSSSTDFDITPIIKDISGIRVVLDHINSTISPSREKYDILSGALDEHDDSNNSDESLNSKPTIVKLLSNFNENIKFTDTVDEYCKLPIQSGKQYFEYKMELLKRIIDATPKEFTDERKPAPSFFALYKEVKDQYNYFSETDSFPSIVSVFQKNELKDLSNVLRFRTDDKLHFAILEKTLPIVFEQPLIKNALKTHSEFIKPSLKPNGFQSLYYNLDTPFGPIEVQAQSNKAYYTSTKGSAYHSGMNGKNIDVKEFFELSDPNDEYDVSYYLDILDSVSADSMISPYELPEFDTEQEKQAFLKTEQGIAFLQSEKYRELMKHIQIKKTMEILPNNLPKEIYYPNSLNELNKKKLKELIDNGQIKPFIINTNSYLLSTALSLSPYMNVCSSGHTSFTTAQIHHKKVIGEFSEVLRKKDSNTCLRDLLIRRLEYIIETGAELDLDGNTLDSSFLKVIEQHDKAVSKLPKDISQKNIVKYAEKLRNIEQSVDSDLEL